MDARRRLQSSPGFGWSDRVAGNSGDTIPNGLAAMGMGRTSETKGVSCLGNP